MNCCWFEKEKSPSKNRTNLLLIPYKSHWNMVIRASSYKLLYSSDSSNLRYITRHWKYRLVWIATRIDPDIFQHYINTNFTKRNNRDILATDGQRRSVLFLDFLLRMWLHQNDKYHSEDIAYTRQKGELLDTALLAEHYKGIENLHSSLRSFSWLSRASISKLHQNQKLHWLWVLHIARERTNSIIDEFSTEHG